MSLDRGFVSVGAVLAGGLAEVIRSAIRSGGYCPVLHWYHLSNFLLYSSPPENQITTPGFIRSLFEKRTFSPI